MVVACRLPGWPAAPTSAKFHEPSGRWIVCNHVRPELTARSLSALPPYFLTAACRPAAERPPNSPLMKGISETSVRSSSGSVMSRISGDSSCMRCTPLSSSASICCMVLSTFRSCRESGCTISVSSSGRMSSAASSAGPLSRVSRSSRADSGISQVAKHSPTTTCSRTLINSVSISRRRLFSPCGRRVCRKLRNCCSR